MVIPYRGATLQLVLNKSHGGFAPSHLSEASTVLEISHCFYLHRKPTKPINAYRRTRSTVTWWFCTVVPQQNEAVAKARVDARAVSTEFLSGAARLVAWTLQRVQKSPAIDPQP